MSIEVLDALDLPPFYREVLQESEKIFKNPALALADSETARLAKAVSASRELASAVVTDSPDVDISKAVAAAAGKYGLDTRAVAHVMSEIPKVFKDHCSAIELQLPDLPQVTIAALESTTASVSPTAGAEAESFNSFVAEIRQAVDAREPTSSIITTVMETFAWSLKYDRVLLMLTASGKSKLVGRMLLGTAPGFEPRRFERSLGADAGLTHPEINAFRLGRVIYQGDSIFHDGWPLVAVPIGFGSRCIGVIYADRAKGGASDITSQEQASIGVLAELLDRSLALQAS